MNKTKDTDLCPFCTEVVNIYNSAVPHSFICPNCHKRIYWDTELKLLKKYPNKEPEDKWKIRKLSQKELLYISLCFGMVILYILFFSFHKTYQNHKYEKIINQLTILESNTIKYIDNTEYSKAELEINKMNILSDLPDTEKNIWKANKESLIHLLEEKSGKKIKDRDKQSLWDKIFNN